MLIRSYLNNRRNCHRSCLVVCRLFGLCVSCARLGFCECLVGIFVSREGRPFLMSVGLLVYREGRFCLIVFVGLFASRDGRVFLMVESTPARRLCRVCNNIRNK